MCVCVLITAGPSTKCVDQTGWNTKKHPGFRILLCFALIALPGSAARIVRSGIWWWLAVLGGDNCHSGGPVQHPGFVGLAPGETQSGRRLCTLLSCS
jgi:hypothetical protein